jgi:hypothetical protein
MSVVVEAAQTRLSSSRCAGAGERHADFTASSFGGSIFNLRTPCHMGRVLTVCRSLDADEWLVIKRVTCLSIIVTSQPHDLRPVANTNSWAAAGPGVGGGIMVSVCIYMLQPFK